MLSFDPEALVRFVVRATGVEPSALEAMPGGASTRRYFRLGAAGQRLVAMFVPDAAPEEATTPGEARATWPFLEVRALLEARGVRVPKLVAEACDEGFLLLEDLGDDTLGAFLERRPGDKDAIYRQAVIDLARSQRALAELPAGSVVATRAFDETLLRWELDHFREWALDARGRTLEGDERAAFDAAAGALAKEIAGWPRGFVHRDYQSRNLMVVGGAVGPALAWIDFQDALLGPQVYDLVALLNDSYVSIDRAFIEARLDDFAGELGLTNVERERLGARFDAMTVQRKMKDAGRFVFIDRVKKNPAFLPYFEPSLAKVRASLARIAEGPAAALGPFVDRALA